MNVEIKMVIEQLIEKINHYKKKIEDAQLEVENLSVCSIELLHKIINSLNLCFQQISHNLSKVTILLSERPLPKNNEMLPLYNELSNYIAQFSSIIISLFCLHCGQTFKIIYRKSFLAILDSILEILNQITNDVFNKEKLLVANGFLWECGRQFQELPGDVLKLCLVRCQTEYGTLVDAEEELNNELRDHEQSDMCDDVDDSTWSENDLKLLPPVIGIIKTSYSLCKKIQQSLTKNGHMESTNQINDLNEISNSIQSLSPQVDELVTSLYPPLDKKQVFIASKSLVANFISVLESLNNFHFILDPDKKWTDFLRIAIDHNSAKLYESLECSEDLVQEFDKIQITTQT